MKLLNEEPGRTYQIIGSNVRYFRQLANLKGIKMTQEDLAEKANLSISVIGNLESSSKVQGVSIHSLISLSKALGVEAGELLKARNKKDTEVDIKKIVHS